MTRLNLPLEFRSHEVGRILRFVTAGDSCSIVGIGSVGKTNLLRFLTSPEVLQRYLPTEADHLLPVFIDSNKLARPTRWGFYELMLFQLIAALRSHPVKPDLADLEACYTSLIASTDRALAIRWLDRALLRVFADRDFKVMFLLDEFDHLYRRLPGRALAGLRALRDDFKYRLTFVVSTRLELARLRAGDADVESFSELVQPHLIWLSGYGPTDSAHMLARLGTRYQASPDPANEALLIELCGGHPGLMSAAFQAWMSGTPLVAGDLSEHLAVAGECARIWNCLPAEEQRVLANLATGATAPISPSHLGPLLHEKGLLVTVADGKQRLFSALFSEHLLHRKPPLGARLYVDPPRRAVYLDQQRVAGLSGREFRLIELLDARRGELVTYDEMSRLLYPEDKNLDGRMENNDQLAGVIKRLRAALRAAVPELDLIATLRGEGLRLEDGHPNSSSSPDP